MKPAPALPRWFAASIAAVGVLAAWQVFDRLRAVAEGSGAAAGGSESARIERLLGPHAPAWHALRHLAPAGAIVLLRRRESALWAGSHLHQLLYPLRLIDQSLIARVAELPEFAPETALFVLDLAPQGSEDWQQPLELVASNPHFALWRARPK